MNNNAPDILGKMTDDTPDIFSNLKMTVPDLSARYLPEWAICCHSNFGAQRAHIQSNQQDSTTFICQVRMASQDRIYLQNTTEI